MRQVGTEKRITMAKGERHKKKNDRKYKEYKKYIRKKGSGSRGKTLLKAHQQLTCWGVDEASGKVRQPRPAIKRKQQLKNDFIN